MLSNGRRRERGGVWRRRMATAAGGGGDGDARWLWAMGDGQRAAGSGQRIMPEVVRARHGG